MITGRTTAPKALIKRYPQCINDLSFWLPPGVQVNESFAPNDFYDLVRNVAGDVVEQISLIDQSNHLKKNRTSDFCFRIIYRHMECSLTQKETIGSFQNCHLFVGHDEVHGSPIFIDLLKLARGARQLEVQLSPDTYDNDIKYKVTLRNIVIRRICPLILEEVRRIINCNLESDSDSVGRNQLSFVCDCGAMWCSVCLEIGNEPIITVMYFLVIQGLAALFQ
uniref:FDX-ACB domain-containing protein n=1 Tax=Glossina austeni TaxID=7395 RepID=A0A1A9VX38_GLOAU